MNRKGFTVIELIGTLLVLGIVASITIVGVSGIFDNAKEKTEEVFVGTIKDALDMYLASNAKEIKDWIECENTLDKSYKTKVKVYRTSVNMGKVIATGVLTEDDFYNPATDSKCPAEGSFDKLGDISVLVYKDEDHVYYYSVNKVDFGCLNDEDGVISNLPKVLDESGKEVYFTCP